MKIGVFAGTFDPIHKGHLAFIDQAIEDNSLDKVIILIEKKPRHKPAFSDYRDRKQMVELATENNPIIEIYNHNAEHSPISNCLPKIKKENSDAKIYLLIGEDVAEHIKDWPDANNILRGVEIIVAGRSSETNFGETTSGKIRFLIKDGDDPVDLDDSVLDYIKNKKLYESSSGP